jgi:hypothetical protein
VVRGAHRQGCRALEESGARGEAAARRRDAVRAQLLAAGSTLHRRSAGDRTAGRRFRHHRGNACPTRARIVDETPMVSLAADGAAAGGGAPAGAARPRRRPRQLTSIEGDAVGRYRRPRRRPARHRRVLDQSTAGGADATLAEAIRRGDADARRSRRFSAAPGGDMAPVDQARRPTRSTTAPSPPRAQ